MFSLQCVYWLGVAPAGARVPLRGPMTRGDYGELSMIQFSSNQPTFISYNCFNTSKSKQTNWNRFGAQNRSRKHNFSKFSKLNQSKPIWHRLASPMNIWVWNAIFWAPNMWNQAQNNQIIWNDWILKLVFSRFILFCLF